MMLVGKLLVAGGPRERWGDGAGGAAGGGWAGGPVGGADAGGALLRGARGCGRGQRGRCGAEDGTRRLGELREGKIECPRGKH